VTLPIADRKRLVEGVSAEEATRGPIGAGRLATDYVFQAGQPREVRKAYAAAMGLPE